MRIKSQKKSIRKSLLENTLGGKKFMAAIAVIGVLSLTLLFGMYKGIQYGKTNKAGDLRGLVVNMKETNVGVVENYFASLMVDPPQISLDIKHNDFQKLAYYREQSIKQGQIVAEAKEGTVKAVVKYDGKAYDAKVRLIGQNLDHVEDPSKWSLKVALKGSHTLMGMKKMSLVNPFARGSSDANPVHEWLCHQLSANEKLIHLRYSFVDVNINGKEVGIYALEENFNKRLIENNKEREGLIFKPGLDGIDIYGEEYMQSIPKFNQQLDLLESLWEAFLNKEVKASELFDLEKMASYYAIADLVNGQHTHWLGNTQYFFNPISRLIEPIGREWEAPYHARASLYLFDPLYDAEYHQLLFDDEDFVSAYMSKLEELCQKEYLDTFLASIADELDKNVAVLHKDYPFYSFSPQFLYDNQKVLLSDMQYKSPDINASLDRSDSETWTIAVESKKGLPIAIDHLLWRDTVVIKDFTYAENNVSVSSALFANSIHEGELSLVYNVPGRSVLKKEVVQLYDAAAMKEMYRFPVKNYNLTHPALVLDEENKTYQILPGKWNIEDRIVIPKGYTLYCEANTSLNFINNGGLLSYGKVNFSGTAESPINVLSSDSTGEGLSLIKAPGVSKIEYVNFEHQNTMKEFGWAMTGAICAYESEVVFEHCVFADNFVGDDYVNFFKSDFILENCTFLNTKSDAFDSDFCKGEIRNCKFINSGNDAIDCSGSQVLITDVLMDGVGDKGLSAGEKSNFEAINVVIKHAELAVACKDLSIITGENIRIDSSRIAYTAYQKKPEYGAASIQIEKSKVNEFELLTLLERRSEIILDGIAYEADNILVKKVLYGAEYGKSSK